MRLFILVLIIINLAHISRADSRVDNEENLGIHYSKYLQDIVAQLDKDHKFAESIKAMKPEDIQNGKLSEQLKHVNEDIRGKLSDLKYLEIKRLRDLAVVKNEMQQYGETYHGNDKRKWRTLGASLGKLPEHFGSDSTHFGVEDLQKLMEAATNDLKKLDASREKDYKIYELEKEWQFQERLKTLNETEKQEAIKMRQKLKEKHDDHPKVHEPGSRQHFEEVWEKKDNLPKQEFDPKTFFALHDTNSDNFWDPQEVRQLLNIEINKMYDPNNPEDDPNEMEEDFERMRTHVYKEIDIDKDGLISLQEFLDYSKKPEFKVDHGWEDAAKKETFSKEDYEDYVKNRDKMVHGMQGYYDPSYYANQPGNLHLPNWGYGMPAGVNPAQYYGYHVDPNHVQAQQMMAAQQHAAYQQQAAAYQQGPGYQQHPPYQQPALSHQGGYQQQPLQYQNQPNQANSQLQQQPPLQQPNIQQQPPQQQAQFQQPQQQAQFQQPQQQAQFQQPQQQQFQQTNQQYQQPPPAQQQPPVQQPQQAPQAQQQAPKVGS